MDQTPTISDSCKACVNEILKKKGVEINDVSPEWLQQTYESFERFLGDATARAQANVAKRGGKVINPDDLK
jgi:histone H3/H4